MVKMKMENGINSAWLFIIDSLKSIRLSSIQAVGIGDVLLGEFSLFFDSQSARRHG
jgi:hypothetical protein